MHCVVIAGTHSGVGKTIVGTCLAAALKKRGYKVQPFKVGPDFIDPTHYSFCDWAVNLDIFMMGEDGVKKSFCKWVKEKDFAIIEGVMGLFDGYKLSSYSSTAHVAKVLGAPVILVVDGRGAALSALAMFEGYRNFDPDLNVVGVIINRGSFYHEQLKKVFSERGYRVLGVIPKTPELEIDSRHLGLKLGMEVEKNWKKLAEICETHVDLDAIIELSKIDVYCDDHVQEEADGKKIGIPFDEAFAFYYRDNIERLKRFGNIEFFSPLKDEFVECDLYYLGGGYPELYDLSRFVKFIRKEAFSEKLIYAECGGFMTLCRKIEFENGESREMAGVLDIDIIFTKKLQALGYVEGCVIRDNPFFVGKFRGHEFHYSYAIPDKDVKFAFKISGKGIRDGFDGALAYNVLAGYTHVHFYSSKFKWEL